MPSLVSLSQGPVLLRPLQPEDQGDRLRVGRDPEYVRLCGGDHRHVRPMTAEQAQGWYERLAAEPYGWAIVVEDRCIGHARLHDLNALDRRVRYAIGIFDPSAWGHGYGTAATRLVLGYAFDVLELHRVDLRVLRYNARAIACYTKCGFQREGIEREGALIAGEWQDDVLMSILEHEYRDLEPGWRQEEHEAP
jgi:ribosomal-protein-alanine N-acetyltransferase